MTFLAIFKMNFFSIITYLNSSFWIHWFLELTLSKYLKLKKLPGTMEPRPKRYFRVSYFFFFKLRESNQFSSVQSLSRVWLFATQWTAARQAPLSFTLSRSLLRLMPTELVMPYDHFILSPASPPAFNLPRHQGQWVDSSHQVANVLELQLQHQSFQWIFRVDFL